MRQTDHSGLRVFGARLKPIILFSILAVIVGPIAAQAQTSTIVAENAKPGTTSFKLTKPALNRQIEGYASLTSVGRGGTVHVFVNKSEGSYTIAVYGMGSYNGDVA